MSGIVAIVAPGGVAIDPVLVERMLDAQRYRGSDGVGLWIDGPVALAHCRLATTPEALGEDQPRANASGTMHVVLDGRLDNRAELTDAMAAAGRSPRSAADADVLLCAYETWGAGCAARLLGDFAYAIWDGERRVLVCGRDMLGGRPLYVHHRGGLVAVASEIAPLMRHPGVRREPNDAFVAECLSGQIVHRTDTLWRDITRLDPGSVLTADGERLSSQRYWQPDPAVEIRYRRDAEYGEHLADLLRSAIRPRLRSHGPLGVMLSGGLDSSSIVGALHQMRAVDGAGRLPAYSMVGPGEEWDETPFIDAVAAKWPVASRRFPSFRAGAAHFAAEAVAAQDLPPYPNGEMANTLLRAASNDGVRVLLTGAWSDEWLTGSYHYYADLARGFRLGALWRHYRAQSDGTDAFHPPSMFRSVVWPLVPRSVREGVKRVLGRDGVAPWVMPAFSASVDLADRIRPAPLDLSFRTRAQADSYAVAFSGSSIHGNEAQDRSMARFGIDARHPFGDRRILEFGLAIPEEQRWRGPLTKYVLRTAARDWLPEGIRGRTTHGSGSVVIYRVVRDLVASGLWQNSVMARRGWVEPGALTRAFNEMVALHDAGDERYDELANRLWLVCGVELWATHVLEEQSV